MITKNLKNFLQQNKIYKCSDIFNLSLNYIALLPGYNSDIGNEILALKNSLNNNAFDVKNERLI